MLLERPNVRWAEAARESAHVGGNWFEKLDTVLNDVDPDVMVTVRCDADTWYVISDADLVVGKDEIFGTGLDTWEF